MRRLHFGLHVMVGGLSQFEALAIFLGLLGYHRIPTISRICGEHRWVAPVILGGLAVHLYWRELGGKPLPPVGLHVSVAETV